MGSVRGDHSSRLMPMLETPDGQDAIAVALMGDLLEQLDLELQFCLDVFVLVELFVTEIPLFQHLDETGHCTDRSVAGIHGFFPHPTDHRVVGTAQRHAGIQRRVGSVGFKLARLGNIDLERLQDGPQIDTGSLHGEVVPHLIQRVAKRLRIPETGCLGKQHIVGVHALCQRQGVDGLLPRLQLGQSLIKLVTKHWSRILCKMWGRL